MALFQDRYDAGQQLAKKLSAYAHRDDVIVLGLPRGGVPVAFEVAKALAAPLDLFLVRKLGVPGRRAGHAAVRSVNRVGGSHRLENEASPLQHRSAGRASGRLHEASPYNKLLLLDEVEAVAEFLDWRGHRAIGVVYHPERERHGNYVPTILPRRYDAFLYLDETQALHPLHIEPDAAGQPPETYPWGV